MCIYCGIYLCRCHKCSKVLYSNYLRCAYRLGMTGIPVYNVNNNGATGSSSVHLGYNLVRGGIYDCVMVVGF